jgi:hypothetical protein
MGGIQRSSTKLGTCVVFGSSQPEQPAISSGLPEYCATGKTRPYATLAISHEAAAPSWCRYPDKHLQLLSAE